MFCVTLKRNNVLIILFYMKGNTVFFKSKRRCLKFNRDLKCLSYFKNLHFYECSLSHIKPVGLDHLKASNKFHLSICFTRHLCCESYINV